jgi:hypothetical protein
LIILYLVCHQKKKETNDWSPILIAKSKLWLFFIEDIGFLVCCFNSQAKAGNCYYIYIFFKYIILYIF